MARSQAGVAPLHSAVRDAGLAGSGPGVAGGRGPAAPVVRGRADCRTRRGLTGRGGPSTVGVAGASAAGVRGHVAAGRATVAVGIEAGNARARRDFAYGRGAAAGGRLARRALPARAARLTSGGGAAALAVTGAAAAGLVGRRRTRAWSAAIGVGKAPTQTPARVSHAASAPTFAWLVASTGRRRHRLTGGGGAAAIARRPRSHGRPGGAVAHRAWPRRNRRSPRTRHRCPSRCRRRPWPPAPADIASGALAARARGLAGWRAPPQSPSPPHAAAAGWRRRRRGWRRRTRCWSRSRRRCRLAL